MNFETMDAAVTGRNQEYVFDHSRQPIGGDARAKTNMVVRDRRATPEGDYAAMNEGRIYKSQSQIGGMNTNSMQNLPVTDQRLTNSPPNHQMATLQVKSPSSLDHVGGQIISGGGGASDVKMPPLTSHNMGPKSVYERGKIMSQDPYQSSQVSSSAKMPIKKLIHQICVCLSFLQMKNQV